MTLSTLYRRSLPSPAIAFASPEGRQLFAEALAQGGLEGYFAVAEQLHTQAEPAYCGLASLVVALNALAIDPGRIWKGPWRWYSEELLDCCRPLEVVQKGGLTFDELACLARCQSVTTRARRHDEGSLEQFRLDLAKVSRQGGQTVMIAAYSRASLGQSGEGHYSPVAGYHEGRDLALVLDVARFKYPPHWLPVEQLFAAMAAPDPSTGRPRGYLLLSPGSPVGSVLCRLRVGPRDWRQVAHFFGELWPASLAQHPPSSVQAVLAAFARALPPTLLGALETASPEAAGSTLSVEHRSLIEGVLGTLRQLPLHRSVERALEGGGAELPRAEAVTLLVLASPESAFAALPDPLRQQLADLRRLPPGSPLGAEIDVLSGQLTTLLQAA